MPAFPATIRSTTRPSKKVGVCSGILSFQPLIYLRYRCGDNLARGLYFWLSGRCCLLLLDGRSLLFRHGLFAGTESNKFWKLIQYFDVHPIWMLLEEVETSACHLK